MVGKIRSALVDFSGIWGTIVILLSIFGITVDLRNSLWWYVIVGLLVLLLASTIFTTRRQLMTAHAKRVVETALVDAKPNAKRGRGLSASIVTIPEQKVLESAYLLLKERAEGWSDDVSIGSFSFTNSYYDFMDPSESFDLAYHSSWRGLSCTAVIGSYLKKGEISERLERKDTPGPLHVQVDKPFMMRLQNWSKALRLAIQSVEQDLDGAEQITVSMYDSTAGTANEVVGKVYIKYKKDNLETTRFFKFDGKSLTDQQTGKGIVIK